MYDWMFNIVIIFGNVVGVYKVFLKFFVGCGGLMFLVNVLMMLLLVIGGIKRVLLCFGYNNSVMIEKGFFGKCIL